MACNVKRNNQGEITSVRTEQGQESQLFEALNSNIYFNSPEIALQIYSNAYSDEIKELYSGSGNVGNLAYETGEPKIYFKDLEGNIVEELEDIIIAGNEGRLDLGFVNPQDNSFMRVATFNTSLTPRNKFITDQISKGIIDAKLTQGKLMGKGNYVRHKVLMARLFQDEASPALGEYVTVEQDGSITIENDISDYVPVYTTDGNVEVVSQSELNKVLERDDVLYKEDLFIRANNLLTKTFDQIGTQQVAPKNKIHTVKLVNFLSSLGISITTMDNYRASYTVRHGQDKDVAGLIDLSNRVVALAEGVDIQEVITEEVAHLAVEAYNDQSSIISAMMEVENTQEYRDWAEVYRNKYSDEYSGLELENKVRKEILGKVLARSVQEDNFTPEVLTLWQRFLNFISSRFTQRHKSVLTNTINSIKKDILDENYTSFSSTNLGDGVFFSLDVNDKISNDINRGYAEINKIQQTFGKHSGAQLIGTLERVEKDVDNLNKLENASKLLSTVKSNLNILSESSKSRNINGREVNSLSQLDYTIFNSYNENIPKILNELRRWTNEAEFSTTNEKQIAQAVAKDINDVLARMGTMESQMAEIEASTSQAVLDEVISNLPEDKQQLVRNGLEAVNKDVGFFHKLFTPLSQSSNHFVGVLGKFIEDMYSQTASIFKNAVQGYTADYEAQNWRKYEKSIIARDEQGKATYYYEDGVDYQAMENNRLSTQLDILQRLRPEVDRKELEKQFNQYNLVEVLRKTNPEKSTEEIKTEAKAFQKEMNNWELENNTSRFKKEYYDNLERIEQIANVSPDSLMDMARFRRQRNEVMNSAIVDGKADMSLLTDREKATLEEINRQESIKRSPVDTSGGFYPGIKVAKWDELTSEEKEHFNVMQRAFDGKDFNSEDVISSFTVLEQGTRLEDLSIDARFVLDSFNMRMVRNMENKSKGISTNREASQEFKDKVDEIDRTLGREEAIKFIQENSRITYSDSYYDSIDSGSPDYITLAQQEINEEKDDLKRQRKQEALDRYKDITAQRREILKAYKNAKDSTEIQVEDLTAILRTRIIEIDEETVRLRRIINLQAELELNTQTEKTVGASFENMRRESGKSSFDFALGHMTPENRIKSESFKNYLDRSRNSDVFAVKEFEEFLSEIYDSGEFNPQGLTEEQGLQILADIFARRNMASYMYSYKIPREREAFVDSLMNFQGKLSEAPMQSREGNFQLNPNFQWTDNDGNQSMIDTEYSPKKGKMPRLSKYRNDNYFTKYGITEEEWQDSESPSELTPKSNVEEFNLLKAVTEVNEFNNEKTNSRDNIFLRPQISKTNLEKVKTGLKLRGVKENIAETVKEFYTDRIDVMEYGEQELASIGAKLPPKMFRRKLEDPSLISDDSFSSAMLLLKESYLYEQRMKTKHKVDALRNKLLGSEFKTGIRKKGITVSGQVSETLKVLNEAADYHLFGVRQTLKLQVNMGGMEVDLTPLIIKMQKFSSLSNLAFSPFIAATSLATGVYNNLENAIIGQHYSKDSVRMAIGKIGSDFGTFTGQAGKINNTSRMSGLMETFGLTDTTERLRNSGAGRTARNLLRSPFGLDRLANLPVVPQILYTVLFDYRFTNGQYMSHSEFVTYQKTLNASINKTEIKNKWNALKGDTFFDALQNDNGVISIKESVEERLPQSQWDSMMNTISAKAKNLAQQVDGQLSEADKLAANRNILLNLTMQHRGWLFINVARMFKGRQFNYKTNVEEEGTYYTAMAFAKDILLAKGNFVKAFGNLDELSKTNIKRVGLQAFMLQVIFLLSLMMKGGDDDDDTFVEDFTRYITYRTYGESSSVTPIGMFRNIQESLRQPIVAVSLWDKIGKTIESTYNDKDDDVLPNVRKLVGAKTYDQLYVDGIDATTQSWLYHNRETMGRIYSDSE